MDLFLLGFLSLLIGGVCALLLPGPWKTRALLFFSLVSFLLILIPSFIALFSNKSLVIAAGWFSVRTDALGAFFQMMIGSMFFFSVVFVSGYLKRNNRAVSGGRFLFFMTLFAASFLALTVVRNAAQFLVAWQAMILTFYFASEGRGRSGDFFSRHRAILLFEAGFVLIAAGLLVFLFSTGGWNIADLERVTAVPSVSIAVFLLLAAGFTITAAWPFFGGVRSGDPLFSLFSVFLSAAGTFGLLRTVFWTGDSAGMFVIGTFIVLSAVIAVWGAVTAVGKKDLTSFLTFSGTMNFGLTGLAAGLGLMGMYYDNTMMAVSGFSAALFQVVNHSISRTLVLFSAGKTVPGAVLRVDRPSVPARTMPSSAIYFFIGALAMTGLPMLNGLMNFFLSSFGIASTVGRDVAQSVCLTIMLAGTALPVLLLFSFFSKTYSLVWFPVKMKRPKENRKGKYAMGLACIFLTALVFATGVFPQYIAIFTVNPATDLTGTVSANVNQDLMSVYSRLFNSLNMVSKTLLTFAGLAVILYLVRLFVLTKKDLDTAVPVKAPARRSGR